MLYLYCRVTHYNNNILLITSNCILPMITGFIFNLGIIDCINKMTNTSFKLENKLNNISNELHNISNELNILVLNNKLNNINNELHSINNELCILDLDKKLDNVNNEILKMNEEYMKIKFKFNFFRSYLNKKFIEVLLLYYIDTHAIFVNYQTKYEIVIYLDDLYRDGLFNKGAFHRANLNTISSIVKGEFTQVYNRPAFVISIDSELRKVLKLVDKYGIYTNRRDNIYWSIVNYFCYDSPYNDPNYEEYEDFDTYATTWFYIHMMCNAKREQWLGICGDYIGIYIRTKFDPGLFENINYFHSNREIKLNWFTNIEGIGRCMYISYDTLSSNRWWQGYYRLLHQEQRNWLD